jgi:hypothetical protein
MIEASTENKQETTTMTYQSNFNQQVFDGNEQANQYLYQPKLTDMVEAPVIDFTIVLSEEAVPDLNDPIASPEDFAPEIM